MQRPSNQLGVFNRPACARQPAHPSFGVHMSHSHQIRVLFLCNNNAARSLMAEALLKYLGGSRFHAYSAGSTPTADGKPDSRTIAALEAAGLPTAGLRSKSWDEYGLPVAPHMDLIVTLCDEAAEETCPVWPGHPATAHWSYADPLAKGAEGADGDPERFAHALLALRRHIELLVNLPDQRIDRLVLESEARSMGRHPS